MKKNNNHKKPCYVCGIIKSGHFLFSILLAVTVTCLLALDDKFLLLNEIKRDFFFFLFFVITVGLFALQVLLYALIKIKSRSLTFADTVGVSLIFFAVIYSVYLLFRDGFFTLSNFSLINLCLIGGCLILGLTYSIVRSFYCSFEPKTTPDFNSENKKFFFKKVFSKYYFVGAFTSTLLTSALAFLLCVPGFIDFVSNKLVANAYLSSTIIVAVAFLILWVVFSLSAKKTVPFDLFLVSLPVTFVVALLAIIFINFSVYNIVFWAIALAIYLLVAFIRLVNFPKTEVAKKESACYFVKAFEKYDVFSILALASISVAVFGVIYSCDFLTILSPTTAFGISKIYFFPLSLIAISVLFLLLFGASLSLTTLFFKKKILLGDFFLIYFTTTCLLALVTIPVVNSIYFTFALSTVNVLNLSLLVSKARS